MVVAADGATARTATKNGGAITAANSTNPRVNSRTQTVTVHQNTSRNQGSVMKNVSGLKNSTDDTVLGTNVIEHGKLTASYLNHMCAN